MRLASRIGGVFGSGWRQPAALAYRLLLLGLVAWACSRSLTALWPFTIDDAGISYAYARHIAQGAGPVAAVGGPWVEGYSNPLWVFLLVPFEWLGAPLPSVAKVLGALLFAAALALGAALLRLDGERRAFGALEVLFAIAMATCLELVVWVVAGLENSLFSSLILLLAWLDARESQAPERLGISGLAAFALCITRPEGAMYAAPLLAIKLAQALRKREPWRQAITAAALLIAPLVAYHALHYFIFGELVPNTYYAKPGRDASRGYAYLVSNLKDTGLIYTLPLAALGLVGSPRRKLLLGWSCVAGVFFILYSGGDWMPHGRFLLLFAPALLVLAALGVKHLVRALGWLARGRVPREPLQLCVAAALLWLWWDHHAPRLQKVAARPWCHFCERVADTEAVRRLSRRAGLSSYSLVTHDFGGPAWLSDAALYPIDFLGLCDPSMARIRHDRARNGPRGSVGHDFRLYQYIIHEQAPAPSWLYVPPNFWWQLKRSAEFRGDYFELDPRLLRHARRDAVFGLHRGELVDYFPPVESAGFRALTPRLALVGAALSLEQGGAPGAAAAAGVELRVLSSVVTRGSQPRAEYLKLRVEGGAESVESAAVPLARGIDGVLRQLENGEPSSVELSLKLPAPGIGPYEISLGVSGASQKRGKRGASGPSADWVFTALASLTPGSPLPPSAPRILPRYPAALPAPLGPELRQLRQAVTAVIEQRRRAGHATTNDAGLAGRLIELGAGLERAGRASQAYLAYVWATQVDRRAWERLADDVFRLRQPAMDDAHTTELMLLQHYYASADAAAASRLVAFYLAAARPLEAQYFLDRWPAAGAAPAPRQLLAGVLDEQLRSSQPPTLEAAENILRLVAEDPLGGELGFEPPGLDAWQGDEQIFSAGPPGSGAALKGLRGQHGHGVLSSYRAGKRGRGVLLSPEFLLRGSHLSLLVGGGSKRRRVGVELLVAGQVVRSAYGNDSNFMYPELWDITEHAGKAAQLRVFDRSKRSHVLLDRVLLWR